ncbi:MAG: ammonium transporter [Clostridiales bacterium]|nr:ammonium transporter [Eubacteriales bacterium]MDH7567204.1 ammonium transporter [Clostridiales bacterium]
MKNVFKATTLIILAVIVFSSLCMTVFAAGDQPVADPGGTNTGSISDIAAANAGQPTLDEIGTQVGKNKLGINYVWVLLTGMLIFFFQAGFALVETGFTRAKNAMHTMAMNFMVFLVGAVGYYLVGFALQFGGVGGWPSLGAGAATLNGEISIPGFGGLFGTKGFMLSSGGTYDVAVFALFFFQMVFMDTTCTIPTGSMAERVKFSAIVIGSLFVSMIYYPLFGNWMWGGGWLSQLGKNFGLGHGAVDFAGSSVVHAMGGMMALAGAIIIGPRIGKFKKDGTPVAMPGHDIPMAMFGTIVLFFCWFAFNAGSTTNGTDFRLAVVATNTMIAGAVGGLVAMFYMWIKYGKPDPSMTCNGALAGLVAITAPCAFVNSIAAFFIGAVAGILVCVSVYVIEYKFKIDDPVGAVSVHAVNGVWGILSLGLFADGTYGDGLNGIAGGVRGLLYGDPGQLVAQLINIGVLIVWGFGISYVFYKIVDKVWGLRVKPEDEEAGLDIPEMGCHAYPDFELIKSKGDLFIE